MHTRALLCLFAAACGPSKSLEPSLEPVRSLDVGAADAGTPPDAGERDAGTRVVDGGALDAGCRLGSQDCGPGAVCLFSSPATPPPTACFKGCDVVRQDCGSGLRCEYGANLDGGAPVRRCVTGAGLKPKGAACGGNGECGPGLVCLAGGTGGVCEKYCHTVADCPSGEVCLERVDFEGEYPLVCSPTRARPVRSPSTLALARRASRATTAHRCWAAAFERLAASARRCATPTGARQPARRGRASRRADRASASALELQSRNRSSPRAGRQRYTM